MKDMSEEKECAVCGGKGFIEYASSIMRCDCQRKEKDKFKEMADFLAVKHCQAMKHRSIMMDNSHALPCYKCEEASKDIATALSEAYEKGQKSLESRLKNKDELCNELETIAVNLQCKLSEAGAENDLYKSSLRIIADPERQDKYTPQQIAKHTLRMEPLKP
jgi:phage anti-repressor protein